MYARKCIFGLWVFVALLLVPACDSIEPESEDFLVVEGFVKAGEPLPAVRLVQAQSLGATSSAQNAVRDAAVRFTMGQQVVEYLPSGTNPGKYEPIHSLDAPARARFRLDIDWRGKRASTEDIIPPPVRLDSVRVVASQHPVAAILVDTLRLDNPQVGAQKGYIYPVDVQLWWTVDFQETGADSLYWIETRLKPQLDFSSKVLDVFLRTEEVQRENEMGRDAQSRRIWKGVYAVPVTDSLTALPDHTINIQLVRGSKAYGLYAASRNTPERREPISNVDGAIGIVAGVSLDTMNVDVRNGRQVIR